MIGKYVISFLNGGVEITTTDIKMQGFAGAPLDNDTSPGGFFVDLQLIFGSENTVKVNVRVSHNSQPEDTTSLESIKEWAIAQLDAQYGVSE